MLAHRGLARDAPENTHHAFAKAVAIGAEYVE
ncbi:MAG: glycerophosphodiester phosphodiesterase family protein, partial [Agromyces sp.]